jgi:hypothetical protein
VVFALLRGDNRISSSVSSAFSRPSLSFPRSGVCVERLWDWFRRAVRASFRGERARGSWSITSGRASCDRVRFEDEVVLDIE